MSAGLIGLKLTVSLYNLRFRNVDLIMSCGQSQSWCGVEWGWVGSGKEPPPPHLHDTVEQQFKQKTFFFNAIQSSSSFLSLIQQQRIMNLGIPKWDQTIFTQSLDLVTLSRMGRKQGGVTTIKINLFNFSILHKSVSGHKICHVELDTLFLMG